ncbi:5'-AMP-activated protein kinase subunit gamma-1 [Datura stramonium]|uniref:5'-AMP-activated protein kinase subunit gamma-1 n=1 Tax=Datura stramonium TaxID=4076 RepID=A0ABS8SH63_DATST|nr:5'-AMP-activated protein kinase subunit gamma-1 [Datura stramonium]
MNYRTNSWFDGVWQVDQEQLCVQDEYGVINNLIFVKESDSTPSGFTNRGALKPIMQLSDNEIDISRHHLFIFLSSYRAYELIQIQEGVALDTEVAVKQAFHIMYEQGLAVMPLFGMSECNDLRNAYCF